MSNKTPTTGAVARFEELASNFTGFESSLESARVSEIICAATAALAEQAAEIERLKAELAIGTRFAPPKGHEDAKAFVRRKANCIHHPCWTTLSGDCMPCRVEQAEAALADARAAGVREGLEQAYKWMCENLDIEHNQRLFRTEFKLDGKGGA